MNISIELAEQLANQHAKKVAIEFTKWLLDNYFPFGDCNDVWMGNKDGKFYNPDELYELFLKSLK